MGDPVREALKELVSCASSEVPSTFEAHRQRLFPAWELCPRWQAAWAAAESALAALPEDALPEGREPALKRFQEIEVECGAELQDETPLERLRFFCSLAMNGQDWLDVEPFFDALSAPPQAPQALTEQEEREAFELARGFEDIPERDHLGDYVNPFTQCRWEGWQAGRAALRGK